MSVQTSSQQFTLQSQNRPAANFTKGTINHNGPQKCGQQNIMPSKVADKFDVVQPIIWCQLSVYFTLICTDCDKAQAHYYQLTEKLYSVERHNTSLMSSKHQFR